MDRSSAPPREHFALLDGLRGLAAIIVLYYHITVFVYDAPYFPHAYLAVDFFFVLSGFVVANAYEKKLRGGMTFPRFMAVRLTRLYPMIFIGVLLGAFVLLVRLFVTHALTFQQLAVATVSGLALVPTDALAFLSPHAPPLFPINGPLWSLFFEIIINGVYAACLRWLTTGRIWGICILSAMALVYVAVSYNGLDAGFASTNILGGVPRATYSFFAGVLICRHRPAWVTGQWTGILLAAVLAVILLAPFAPETWEYDAVAALLAFPLIVLIGVTGRSGVLSGPTYLALGALSYPLYLIHDPISRVVLNMFKLLHMGAPLWIEATACSLFSTVLAFLLLILFDLPIRKWLGSRIGKTTVTLMPLPAAM